MRHNRTGSAASPRSFLLLLGTTAASLLSSLDGLLVALGLTVLHGAHEATSSLEGTLELAGGGLAVEVDLDEVALEQTLDGDDALDQQRVGVLHVEVHESHHGNGHELTTEGGAELLDIVGVDGGGDELAFFAGSHGGGLDVFEGGQVCSNVSDSLCRPNRLKIATRLRTLLLVDNALNIQVDDTNEDIATNVDGANNVEHLRVVERNALRHLHHTQDDDQVGAANSKVSRAASLVGWRLVQGTLNCCAHALSRLVVNLHLGVEACHYD